MASKWLTMTSGIASFFKPNPLAFMGTHMPLGADAAGYYSTAPLQATLNELVDFDLVNQNTTRLTVGAANVRTSEMRYFDSRDMPLDARACHGIRRSAAGLSRRSASTATSIGTAGFCRTRRWRRCSTITRGAIRWCSPCTSGIRTAPSRRRSGRCLTGRRTFSIPAGRSTHIARQKQLHRLRHVVSELVKRMPEQLRQDPEVQDLAGYGCLTRMHVVRLLAPTLDGEDHTKDTDFSPAGIHARWAAGYEDTRRLIAMAPWEGEFDAIEGFILHEAKAGTEVVSG